MDDSDVIVHSGFEEEFVDYDPGGGDHLASAVADGGSSADGVVFNVADDTMGGGENPGRGYDGATAVVEAIYLDGCHVRISFNAGGAPADYEGYHFDLGGTCER